MSNNTADLWQIVQAQFDGSQDGEAGDPLADACAVLLRELAKVKPFTPKLLRETADQLERLGVEDLSEMDLLIEAVGE